MSWDDIVGHEVVKRIWQAHLADDCVSNAYLLAGPEGIGKRRLALEMAKALTCTEGRVEGCDRCATCLQIAKGTHPDLHVAAPAGASQQIRIEDIRYIIGRISLRPFSARKQVVLMDGAERLTEEAANSVLKSLEEPSASTHFLLVTAHLSHCLPTITSRCQIIRCRMLPREAVEKILTTSQACEAATAAAVAPLCGGSVSRALVLAGQWAAYCSTLERLADPAAARWVETAMPETRDDVTQLLDSMTAWLRDVAVAAMPAPQSEAARQAGGGSVALTHADYEQPLRAQARRVDMDRCLATAFELVALRESVEQFVNPRLVASLAREKWLTLVASDR